MIRSPATPAIISEGAEGSSQVQIDEETSLWTLFLQPGSEQADQPTTKDLPTTCSLIFLHGSGKATALSTYGKLLPFLRGLHISSLLYDRRGHGTSDGIYTQSPENAARDLSGLLTHLSVQQPYVLIAHSSGGAVAKAFLYQHSPTVAAMILIETGQETCLPTKVENELYRWGGILGSRPLSIIRGNSFRHKFDELKKLEGQSSDQVHLRERRKTLEAWDAEDENLKRNQLLLSRNARFVNVRSAGHGVTNDRADVVAEEIVQILNAVQAIQDGNPLDRFAKVVAGFFSRKVVEICYED